MYKHGGQWVLVFENSLDIKEKIDKLFYDLKKAEVNLGSTEYIDHHRYFLGITDLNALYKTYGLSEDANYNDVKMFCLVYEERNELQKKIVLDYFEKRMCGGEAAKATPQNIAKYLTKALYDGLSNKNLRDVKWDVKITPVASKSGTPET